jgi:hypothetical protein
MLRIKLSPPKRFTLKAESTQIPEFLMVKKERTKGLDYFKVKEDAKVTIALLK